MSWYDGQILKLTELKGGNGPDFNTTHRFGDEVKFWIDVGDLWHPVQAIVAGVYVGAQGAVHYRLAVEIGNTGLYTPVQIPAGYVTKKEVTKWIGVDANVDAEELRHYMGKSKPELNVVVTEVGQKIFDQAMVGVEIKGFHIKRDFLRKLDEVNNVMGGLLHQVAMIVAQTVIQRTGKFEETFKLVCVDRHTYSMVYKNRKVTVHGVRTEHGHFPFTTSFTWTDAPRPGHNWNVPDRQHEDVFVKRASDFLLSIPTTVY